VTRIILILLLSLTALSAADFKTGLDAYQRGDFATALKEWQPIADQGDPHAQYNLGLLYARGEGVPQDHGKAAEWYRKAAEQGVAAAQYNLGVMYANGQGVPKNAQEASRWFLKAAESDVSVAHVGLARIYNEGEGAFRNYAEAEKWYRKAAGEGVASAAFDLGVMYDLGHGVAQNFEEALKWYRQAADAGYAPAATNIGILYYNAQGVKRDLVQAYAWLARAQKMGDPRAGVLLSTTASRMRPADLKKAQALAAEWKPSAAPPTTETARLFKPMPERKAAPPPSVVAAERLPATTQPAARPRSVWTGIERIIAVGDVHGDYEQFAAVLRSAGLIDSNANWTGGKAHLVQTGDILDRGPDSRAVMDLLMTLEKQAEAAGGGVHCLIGNHEAMNVYGDLRYVSPAELASFRSGTGEASRVVAYPDNRGITAPATPRGGGEPLPEHLPGFAEHRAAFAPEGEYGRWVRGHNAVIKINRTLFVHAGLGPKYASWSIDRINDAIRMELNDFTRLHGGLATDEEGPMWYRGLASGNPAEIEPLVNQLLKNFDVDRIVIGHTYAQAAITPRFGGRVVLIDAGLSRVYDNIGKLACLEIDRGHAFALHRGQGLELPKDDDGPDMLRYLKQAAALDPPPSPLLPRIEALGGK
jgi:TPR repeat protein